MLLRTIALLCILLLTRVDLRALAEEWSDQSGSFKLEAEYVGVEGTSVVLRKPDHSEIRVQIARLSVASRNRAKMLYSAKSRAAASPRAIEVSQSNVIDSEPIDLGYSDDLTLAEAAKFWSDGIRRGDMQVIYLWLPKSFRETLSDPDVKSEAVSLIDKYDSSIGIISSIFDDVVKLLKTKKEFVLNSSFVTTLSSEGVKHLSGHYDQGVETIVAVQNFLDSRKDLKSVSFEQYAQKHGNRIGKSLLGFLEDSPFPLAEKLFDGGKIEQDGDSGTIQIDPSLKVSNWQKIGGVWIPEEFVQFNESGANDKAKLIETLNQLNAQPFDPAMNQSLGMVAGFIGSAIRPLQNAKTQAEFDQGLTQATMVFSMMRGKK